MKAAAYALVSPVGMDPFRAICPRCGTEEPCPSLAAALVVVRRHRAADTPTRAGSEE